MKVSGTLPDYKGLYSCTANSAVLGADARTRCGRILRKVVPPQGFVKAMVEVDEVTEHLKAIEAAGWAVPKDHPDLVPVAEAGRLADILRIQAESERSELAASRRTSRC